MTAAERISAEKERILAQNGFYVPPYRLATLVKTAARMVDLMVKADTNICYEECSIMLAFAGAAIAAVTEGDDDDDA